MNDCIVNDCRPIYVDLSDLLFIFSLIFIVINHTTSSKQAHLLFVRFLEYLLLFLDGYVDEESKNSVSGCFLAFA